MSADDCAHVWGPVELARMTGNPHRKCSNGCGMVSLDLERPMMTAHELGQDPEYGDGCHDCGFRHWADQSDDGRACLDVGPWPCNECDAPVIYSPAFGWYWHVEAPECFLAGDPADYLARLAAEGLRRGADGFEHDAGGAVVDCAAIIADKPAC